jgi:hypothetical protein
MLSCFDQSAMVRLCDVKLMPLTNGPLAPLAEEARAAIAKRDAPSVSTIAHRLREIAPQKDSIEADVAACLALTSKILDQDSGVDFSEEAI